MLALYLSISQRQRTRIIHVLQIEALKLRALDLLKVTVLDSQQQILVLRHPGSVQCFFYLFSQAEACYGEKMWTLELLSLGSKLFSSTGQLSDLFDLSESNFPYSRYLTHRIVVKTKEYHMYKLSSEMFDVHIVYTQ